MLLSHLLVQQILFFHSISKMLFLQAKHQENPQKPQQTETMQVFVRLHNGNGCLIQVDPKTSVLEFKKLLLLSQLSLPDEYQLVYQGRSLPHNDKTLFQEGVHKGSIIHIESSSPMSPRRLRLDVGFFYRGQKLVVRAERQETIAHLKQKICRMIGILPRDQKIIFRGIKLENQTANSLLCLYTPNIAQSGEQRNRQRTTTTTASVIFNKANQQSLKMFRSQSTGDRGESYQVQIKENADQLLSETDFHHEIISPMPNMLTSAITDNLSQLENMSLQQWNYLVNSQKKSNKDEDGMMNIRISKA